MSFTRRLLKTTEFWLFVGLLACYAYFPPRWADWNQNSRMDLTLAIVEQGRFAIDDYYQNTGDYAQYGGHIYTDKAPGTSFLAVPSYAVYRTITQIPFIRDLLTRLGNSEALAQTLREGGTGLQADKVYFAGALYFSAFFSVSIPSALAGVALYRFLALFVSNRRVRIAITLGYGLGTVVFPYSSVLMGQQLAAAFILFAWERLYHVRRGPSTPLHSPFGSASHSLQSGTLRQGSGQASQGMAQDASPHALVVAGALLGLAVLTEFTAALPAVLLVIYTLTGLERKPDIVKLFIGWLPFALLLGYYNAVCFGSPFTSSYRYLVKFSEISSYGIQGFGLPRLEALWGITFSPFRGLFFYSPFLLMALPGWWLTLTLKCVPECVPVRSDPSTPASPFDYRSPLPPVGDSAGCSASAQDAHRAEWGLTLAAVTAHLILISGWYDWKGGFAIGPRNLLLSLPFMMIPAAIALEAAWAHRVLRGAAIGLIVVSCLIIGIASVSGQDFAPIDIANPLVDFFLPKFQSGDITRNLGMFAGLPAHVSLLPIVILIGGLSLWMFRGEPNRSPARA